ncbi:putative HXXXD-type acyl-transferase family protein [Heracleum sosnowskyi]|uniref:HXXXD-type acyl-transferase family protein n=1 Tax=Heracleum sosnowskyi TaxID=360622 RepID=A0AAD8J2J5_9APIA|nr:putative HXXXD-type acyl-transferase family protein [Heracleum sosnowskyi]
MEVDTRSSCSNEKQPLTCSISRNDGKNPPEEGGEKGGSSPVFINHAAIAWHESRREWIGDSSKRLQSTPKDPVICWTTTYEDLLSTTAPFTEPISLTEMVDFLVDIWHDEGLFD